MQFVLIADAFPPLRNSAAVQLRDFAREVVRQGYQLTVMLPTPGQTEPWVIEDFDGMTVLRLRTPKMRDLGYMRRTLGELLMPFAMLRNLAKSPLNFRRWDGIIWYSPSIFHGHFVRSLKKASNCKGYLIIRDIFPEWAVDMELMRRGLAYGFFRLVANYQYKFADVIGIQSEGNGHYFDSWQSGKGRKLEVLQNWLDKTGSSKSSLNIHDTPLAGRRVFVYAGNMGVAQGLDIFIDLAQCFSNHKDVGFLWVGRGSEVGRLSKLAKMRELKNTYFADEIEPDEIPDLYNQCCAGIVALDPRHKSHNIPGKFVTFMQSGLPILANVNAGNDITMLIRNNRVGQVCETNKLEDLVYATECLLSQIESDKSLSRRCRDLFDRNFAVDKAVRQVIAALT